MATRGNTIPAPVVTPSTGVKVTGSTTVTPPLLLPDYGGGIPGKGTVIATFPYYDHANKVWVYPGRPTVGPSADPEIPGILQEIDYKPLTGCRIAAPIPILYGRVRTGGNIARVKTTSSGSLRLLMVWGEGECDAIEKVYSDDVDITADYHSAGHLGTAVQTPDTFILADFGQADALNGICYSVLRLPVGYSLNLTAVIRGKKVYDPRTGLTVYSTNPALCLADFIENYTDDSVDWDYVEIAADYCDEIIAPGVKRWEIGMVLADPKSPDEWKAVLAEFANCYVFTDNGVAKIVPDRARAVDHVLTGLDIREGTFDLRKSGQRNTPTQVFTHYLLPSANDVWNEAEAHTPDVSGSDPLRITDLNMGGFFRAIHAQRKATQFLNYANIADLTATLEMFDRGAEVTKGDVISITHPIGLAAKQFRVLDVKAASKGHWRLDIREYHELLYSTEVVTDPDIIDTDLPKIENVPTPANMVLSEVLYSIAPGETRSKLVATVDAIPYPFNHVYEWLVIEGATTIHTATTVSPAMTWGPLPIDGGVTYLIKCRAKGPVSFSAYQLQEIDILGKQALPLPPATFRVFEAQGTVFFSWTAGMDVDLRGYEIRYGETGQVWEFMDLVNRWGIAAAGETSLVAPGTWAFEIRSFDSVRTTLNPIGQYSATGIRKTITVTSDINSFHINDYPLQVGGTFQFSDSDTVEFSDGDPATFDDAGDSVGIRLVKGTYWTDSGETWGDVFGSDPLTGKSLPIVAYLADTASVWASEPIDFGQVLSLTLGVTSGAEAVVGTVDTFIETKVLEGDSWTRHTQESVKATAQYVRVVYETDSTSRMKVGPDDFGTLHADVVAKEIKGNVSTDGVDPTTIDLGVVVTKYRYVSVTVIGTGIKVAYDNLVTGDPGTLDVYFLDEDTNLPVAADGFYLVQYY